MEADPGRRRERRVRMVNLVEPPQQRNAMVRPMPEVGNKVQGHDRGQDAEPPGRSQRVQQAESRVRRPAGDRARARPAHGSDDDQVDEPQAPVHSPATPELSVGPKTLKR
jgi:hypothetical protein